MQLKPYQVFGLNWLVLLHSEDLNGILADEMVRKYILYTPILPTSSFVYVSGTWKNCTSHFILSLSLWEWMSRTFPHHCAIINTWWVLVHTVIVCWVTFLFHNRQLGQRTWDLVSTVKGHDILGWDNSSIAMYSFYYISLFSGSQAKRADKRCEVLYSEVNYHVILSTYVNIIWKSLKGYHNIVHAFLWQLQHLH